MDERVEALGAEDAAGLVAAIERAAAHLAKHAPGDGAESRMASAVTAHAQHPRAKVRQAVAEAAVHLPDEAFEAVIGVLLSDGNQYVKRAATRSYDARSRAQRLARAQEEQSAGVRQLRGQLADDYGAGALRAADRLSELACGQFVAQFHHELVKVATPLLTAMSELQSEARRPTADRGRLATRADEARALLESMLGLAATARAHAQITSPHFRDESVRAVIDEQVALLRARVGDERRARLRVECAIDASVVIEVDRVLLGQAISNVLQNAVESYAAEGDGEIDVRIACERRKAGTRVAIVVEDRGRGIASDTLPRVGEPFVSSKGTGRGLGVLNVKKMVEGIHGGAVEIENRAGGGTRVTVVLPRRQT